MRGIQKSTATLFNRYSEVFLALRNSVRSIHGHDLGGSDLRILSFGCSIGAEMLTARAYFPDATILGCDINEEALVVAANTLIDDEGQVFRSRPEVIKNFAPYDIILVNSVLCLYPLPKGKEELKDHFPFSVFEDLSSVLIESLSKDGLFALYNANYRFHDLEMSTGFQSLLTPQIEGNGFVDKFAADGTRLTKATQHLGQRTYSHQVLGDGLNDRDFRDCIFHRSRKIQQIKEVGRIVGDAAQLILGLSPYQLKKDEIASGLYEVALEGRIRRREWRKKSLNGSVVSFGSWDLTTNQPPIESDLFIDKATPPRKTNSLKRWFS